MQEMKNANETLICVVLHIFCHFPLKEKTRRDCITCYMAACAQEAAGSGFETRQASHTFPTSPEI